MNVQTFNRAINLVVELQDIADHEILVKKNGSQKADEEILQLTSKLSCRISDVYDDLMEYVRHSRIK